MSNKLGTITRKTLLYRSGVENSEFCINHVQGCSHGCLYPCYAMMMKRRAGIVAGYQDWLQPKIVGNALDLLEKEIPRYKNKVKSVHLCYATDPFMYQQEEVAKLSLEIIKKLNANNIPCTTLTKGIHPVDSISSNGCFSKENHYGITLVSLDESFRKEYEPYTASFQERIEALQALHQKGLRTWVCMEPYPTPNIIKQDLIEILEKISFTDEIIFGKLNYNSKVKEFRKAKEFYNSQSRIITNYCKENKIALHIKTGTLSE